MGRIPAATVTAGARDAAGEPLRPGARDRVRVHPALLGEEPGAG